MEHEEVDLSRKQNNSRETKGRFGVKTNKTLKYYIRARNAHETIGVIDTENVEAHTYDYQGANIGVGISLNAHKNWEILDNNNKLRSSQHDIDVDYGRVVKFKFDNHLNKKGRQQTLHQTIYGHDKNGAKNKDGQSEEPQVISGENRKGFFVKEKRRRGKKGVRQNNNNNRKVGSGSKSSSDSDPESDSDAEVDSKKKNSKVLIVQTHQGTHKIQPFSFSDPQCSCEICSPAGVLNATKRRRETKTEIEALDLSVL